MGRDAEAVGTAVRRQREAGARVAGFVGDDERAARQMGEEMLGGVDELVALDAAGAGEDARPASR